MSFMCKSIYSFLLGSINQKFSTSFCLLSFYLRAFGQIYTYNNIHEKITQFWFAEKGVQFFCAHECKMCNTSANL